MITYVFPGQGSQSKGMGGSLFDEFKELTLKADEVLGYSIKQLCLEDAESNLGETQYTQPALYVVNALGYLKKLKIQEKNPIMLLAIAWGNIMPYLLQEHLILRRD